jgi:hypothetical protein
MAEKKHRTDELEKHRQEVWKLVEDAVLQEYGCLLPPGNVTVSLVLTWTKEKALGLLKGQGKIVFWILDKDYSDGNKRRYLVTVDTDRV